MAVSDRTLDKAGALFSGLDLLRGLMGRGGNNNGPGFALSALNWAIRIWEESGGSKKDESVAIETYFADPAQKSTKLTRPEIDKVAEVFKHVTPAEDKVFRLALMLMKPKMATINIEPKKDDKGKVSTPASVRTEETGVDPRVNSLRGIAEHVKDDLSNAKDVAEMLRRTGGLGSKNEALALLSKVNAQLKTLLCRYFKVETIDKITPQMVKEKGAGLVAMVEDLFKIPDPTKSLSGYNPTAVERGLAKVIPFMPPMPPKPVKRAKDAGSGSHWWGIGMAALVILAALLDNCSGGNTEREISGSDPSAPHVVNIPPSHDKQ